MSRPPARVLVTALLVGVGTPILAGLLGLYAMEGPPPVLTTLAGMGAAILRAPVLPCFEWLGPGALPLIGLFWGGLALPIGLLAGHRNRA